MHLVLTLVGIVATVIVVAGVCSKLDLPSPLVLIAVGVIGSYLPFVPDVALEPEVVLFGLLPPLLYAAAIQTSPGRLQRQPAARSCCSRSAWSRSPRSASRSLVHALLPGPRLGARLRDRRRRRAARRRRRDRDRPTDRAAAPHRHHPRGRVAAQRRDRPGRAEHGDRVDPATVAWYVVGRDFVVAAGGGVLVGLVFFFVIGFIRKHVTDPVIDSGLQLPDPVRGVRHRRGDPRLRRGQRRGRRPAARRTSRRSCRPRSRGSRSG